MTKEELKKLFDLQKLRSKESDNRHAEYLKTRGEENEFDAELAWLMAIRVYAKAKVAYDEAIDQFAYELAKENAS